MRPGAHAVLATRRPESALVFTEDRHGNSYRRLVGDRRAEGKLVVADLTGPQLRATLQRGVELLRLSAEELVSERYAASNALSDFMVGARRLHSAGARHVLVSRAAASALLFSDGGTCRSWSSSARSSRLWTSAGPGTRCSRPPVSGSLAAWR